eukprot:Ihof_evm2s734 gene=Ihof_evmTU2s734
MAGVPSNESWNGPSEESINIREEFNPFESNDEAGSSDMSSESEDHLLDTPPGRELKDHRPRHTTLVYKRRQQTTPEDISGDWDGYLDKTKYDDFTTIDWLRDTSMERKRHAMVGSKKIQQGMIPKWIWLTLGDAWQGWLAVWLIGVLTGAFAAIIAIGAEWLNDLRTGICPSAFWLNQKFCCWTRRDDHCSYWKTWPEIMHVSNVGGTYIVGMFSYTIISVLLAVYASLLVLYYAPYAAGSGIPEVKTILSGFVIHRFLGLCTLMVKTLGLVLSVSAGLSLGKEGPLVHVACCVANVVARFFPKYHTNEAKKREIMSAACAAGVSVAFGAPIGGVLFSLEEVSYYFPHKTMWRSFFCALTAASTLQYLDPLRTGRLVMFYVTYDHPWHLFELPVFIILGVLGGLYGVMFARANVKWISYKKTSVISNWPITEVAVVTMITGFFRYPISLLRINSGAMIHQLFMECSIKDSSILCQDSSLGSNLVLLLGSAIITSLLTIVTFGIKVPAGLFIPSMAVGALIGRALGLMTATWVSSHVHYPYISSVCYANKVCVNPALYAVVGAAAFLGGVTRMTISLVVIIFELTGGLMYIIPVMISVLVSKWLRGYPYLDTKLSYPMEKKAAAVMHPREGEAPLCALALKNNTLTSLGQVLEDTCYKGYPVIASPNDHTLVGYVHRKELQACLDAVVSAGLPGDTRCYFVDAPQPGVEPPFVDLRRCLDKAPLQIQAATQMDVVIELFRKLGLRCLLVTD